MLQKLKENLSAPFTVFVLQISLVAIIIVSVTAVKFLGGDIYTDLKGWYIVNFNDDTSVKEVKNPESNRLNQDVPQDKTETPKEETNEVLSVMSNSVVNKNENSVNSMCLPLQNGTVTSSFGSRTNPITKKSETHKGLDISATHGSNIFAAADGTVELAQKSGSYGNYIIINHTGGLKTLYAHCSKLLVSEGQSIKKGQVIALVGSTGQSTGSHLHFEVISNGQNLDPAWLINW